MNITDLLDRPIAYHRIFVTLTGSVKAAILLSQAMYWQKRAKQSDGWWYKTAEEWEEETGLTRHEQDKARKDCEKYLKTDLRDVPARLYWTVNEDQLTADLFAENGQSSLAKSGKLDSRKPLNIKRNAETTTETTTASKKPYPKVKDQTLEMDRKILALSEVITDSISITPDLSDYWWKATLRKIVEHEEKGQKFETFAKWYLSGNDYNRPKPHQIAREPKLITKLWAQAFKEQATAPQYTIPDYSGAVPNPFSNPLKEKVNA